ncbi:MAG: chemotaxis protein CheC [Deltaproteobacteria bacterium]|nr:chemotaxis protein CheC [Deltaproteobacteria bacterium]
MSLTDADRDLLEAGAREAAEAILRLTRRESARMLAADVESLDAVVARVAPRAVAVAFQVSGGVTGHFALVLSEAGARALAHDLIGGKHVQTSTEKLGKRVTAALTELGNITASAFMNGAADLLHQSCVPSVPTFALGAPAQLVPGALGGATQALVVRLLIGDVDVELVLAR